MGMELWRSIAIHWPGSVVFKLRNGELPGGFCWMVAADPCLGVSLQFVERYPDAFAMCLAVFADRHQQEQ